MIQANGISQHYLRSRGDKPPLVLLHGFTDNGACWLPVAEGLAQDYDVILPDVRGHGKSQRVAGIGFDNEDLAEDAAGLIQALGLNRPAVLGHSLGGLTALILGAAQPDIAACLLLEDPPITPPSTPEQEAARVTWMHQWREGVRAMQTQTPAELIAGEKERKLLVDLEVFEERKPRPVWQELLPQVKVPLLLIYGDTTIVNDATAQEAASLWQNGEAVKIPGAGHSIRRDNINDYLAAVRAFLRQHGS
jgi:N-formylmaleamate deformylase